MKLCDTSFPIPIAKTPLLGTCTVKWRCVWKTRGGGGGAKLKVHDGGLRYEYRKMWYGQQRQENREWSWAHRL